MAGKLYVATLTFTEPLLGTIPLNPEVYTDFIQSKAPNGGAEDELETVTTAEEIEKGTTGFHRADDGKPVIYDYVLKGFFKDACGMLKRVEKSESGKLTAFKKIIDGLVFIEPRRIPLVVNGEEGVLERPLRASTAQGERVALARSQMAPAGSSMTFQIRVLGGVSEAVLREWMDYGALRGLGQWRNASYGRYQYTLKAVEE